MNQQLRTNSETLLAQWMGRLRSYMTGVSFHGRRDYYEILGYNRHPDCLDYAARYMRQDLAKRIINAPVLSTWADPPTIAIDTDDGKPDQAFLDAWKKHCDETPVWKNIIRLDKLAGLGRYAGLVIGFENGGALDSPVKLKDGRKVLYLQPYAEPAIKVDEYMTNANDPQFGQPSKFLITPGRFNLTARTGNIQTSITTVFDSAAGRQPFRIDASKMLLVAEDLLEDNVFGRSRLECVYNLLDDIMKVAGGGAEVWWLVANRGIQVDVDKEMELDEDDEANLTKEFEEWQNELRRIVRTRGVSVKPLAGNPADPTGQFNVLINLVSAATGIPKLILMGSSTSSMSSQQDRASWAERIGERATEYAEPVVFRPYLRKLISAGVLPQPKGVLVINWPEAFKLSPLERGQTSAQMARSAANLEKNDAMNGATDSQGNPKPRSPLFSRAEKRRIVSFGSRVPIFETDHSVQQEKQDQQNQPGATTTEAK